MKNVSEIFGSLVFNDKVSAVEEDCDGVETKTETAARELAETKQSADLSIEVIEDKYNAYNYGESNYQEILALIEGAIEALDEADDVEEIQDILDDLNQALGNYRIIKESDGKYNKTDETLDYGSENMDEYNSIVENEQGIQEGVRVDVTKIEITVDTVANVKNHIKTGEINDFGLNIDKDALKKQVSLPNWEIIWWT